MYLLIFLGLPEKQISYESEQKLKYNQVPKIPKSNSIEPAFDPDHEETTSKLLFQCYRVGAILNKNQLLCNMTFLTSENNGYFTLEIRKSDKNYSICSKNC